jgi:hypothetical protein
MKKILFIGLFFILFAFICQAQSVYSKQNLEKASQEDLNLYLRKAKKTRTAGAVLSITGPIILIAGSAVAGSASVYGFVGGSEAQEDAEAMLGTGVGLMLVGLGATVVGLPLLFTGCTRVKRIKEIKNPAFNGVRMDLAPCNFYSYQTHSHQFGVTLRVSF